MKNIFVKVFSNKLYKHTNTTVHLVLITFAFIFAASLTAKAQTLVSLVGDKDNFGYGGSANPPCVFYNNAVGSLPTGDGAVFDQEQSQNNQTKSWTHNFTLPTGATITSATLQVREYFSENNLSTISLDGVTSSFTPNGFAPCSGPPKIQVFNVAPASLTDGQLNVIMLENTDNITLDYSELTINYMGTTAASITVGGRVSVSNGRGIPSVRVTMTDATGETRTVLTGTSGYYRFVGVPAGETYIFSVSAKRYTFSQSTQVRNVIEDTDDINFQADN